MTGIAIYVCEDEGLVAFESKSSRAAAECFIFKPNPEFEFFHWQTCERADLALEYLRVRLVGQWREGGFYAIEAKAALMELAETLYLIEFTEDAQIDVLREAGELTEMRDPTDGEVALCRSYLSIGDKIESLRLMQRALEHALMIRIGSSKGLRGWANFAPVIEGRFDYARFRREAPEVLEKYLSKSSKRHLRIRQRSDEEAS